MFYFKTAFRGGAENLPPARFAVPLELVAVPEGSDIVPALPMQDREAAFHPNTPARPRRLGKCCLALVLTAASFLSSSATEVSPQPLPSVDQESCPDIPASSLWAARNLLARPTDPDVAKERAKLTLGEDGLPSYDQVTALRNETTVRYLAAHKAGVTVHDATSYMAPLLLDLFNVNSTSPQLPFTEYKRQASDYLHQFGVELVVGDPNTEYRYHSHGPTTSLLEARKTKENIFNLVLAMSNMPQEYITLIGLKKVLLVANAKQPDIDAAAYAEVNGKHDTIAIDIVDTVSEQGIGHEFEHLGDAATCGGPGGMNTDPAYTAYNSGGEYDDKASKLSYPAYQTKISKMIGTINRYRSQGERPIDPACLTQREELLDLIRQSDPNVSLISDYASENVVEDKADVGTNLSLIGAYNNPEDPAMPWRIRGKFTLLFGRLFTYAPKVAHYFKLTAFKGTGRTLPAPVPTCNPFSATSVHTQK